jgi:hypothetical protein
MRRRSVRHKVEHAWQLKAAPALEHARSARELLVNDAGDVDTARRASVEQLVVAAADALDRLAASAPNDDDRTAVVATSDALRGLKFAVEAERVLRGAASPPTGEQLQQADQSHRDRTDDLDRALARLEGRLGAVPREGQSSRA